MMSRHFNMHKREMKFMLSQNLLLDSNMKWTLTVGLECSLDMTRDWKMSSWLASQAYLMYANVWLNTLYDEK